MFEFNQDEVAKIIRKMYPDGLHYVNFNTGNPTMYYKGVYVEIRSNELHVTESSGSYVTKQLEKIEIV